MRPISSAQRGSPNWDNLFAVAQSQLGYFTTQQATTAGYSPQLLHKCLDCGKTSRIRRAIFSALARKESNWLQTVSGKGWCYLLRLYSPTEAW